MNKMKMKSMKKKVGGTINTRSKKRAVRTANPNAIFLPGYSPSKPKKGEKGNARFISSKTDTLECYVNPIFSDNYETWTPEKTDVFRPTLDGFAQVRADLAQYYSRQENAICGGVDLEYVTNSIRYTELLLVAVRSDDFGRRMFGFATLTFNEGKKLRLRKEPDHLKVDVICSSTELLGGGSFLLKAIKDIARSLDAPQIKLESVKSTPTIKFYLKNGFTFSDPNDKDCNVSVDFDDEERFRSTAEYNKHADSLCKMSLINF
jgi:hypothetical protein